MPDKMIDLLFRFLNQNAGPLSQRARIGKFVALSAAETQEVENI